MWQLPAVSIHKLFIHRGHGLFKIQKVFQYFSVLDLSIPEMKMIAFYEAHESDIMCLEYSEPQSRESRLLRYVQSTFGFCIFGLSVFRKWNVSNVSFLEKWFQILAKIFNCFNIYKSVQKTEHSFTKVYKGLNIHLQKCRKVCW